MNRPIADLVVENAAQVLTMERPGLEGPRRGADLREVGAIPDGAVAAKDGDIVWVGPARFGDVIEIGCSVERWGNTSFDTTFTGSVAETPVFTCTITYVVVDHEEYAPMGIPDVLEAHLMR